MQAGCNSDTDKDTLSRSRRQCRRWPPTRRPTSASRTARSPPCTSAPCSASTVRRLFRLSPHHCFRSHAVGHVCQEGTQCWTAIGRACTQCLMRPDGGVGVLCAPDQASRGRTSGSWCARTRPSRWASCSRACCRRTRSGARHRPSQNHKHCRLARGTVHCPLELGVCRQDLFW